MASKENQGVLSCFPPWVCALTPTCWLHQRRRPPACIPRGLGIAGPRLSAWQVWRAVCLAQTGLGSLWPQTRGESGEGPRLLVSFCRTSDFGSASQVHGILQKGGSVCLVTPRRAFPVRMEEDTSLRALVMGPFFIASGAQRLEERTLQV